MLTPARSSAGCKKTIGDFDTSLQIELSAAEGLERTARVLATNSQDIYTLRQLLANCRSAEQRQALTLTQLNRFIAIDINMNGQPLLFML
jgi:hypothetical protein